MKLVGVLSTAVLSLTLGMAIPAFAQQDQHDQQDEQKDKAAQDEKKAQPDKPKQEDKNAQQQDKTKQEEEKKAEQDKNAKPEEKKAEQDKNSKPEEKNAQQQDRNNKGEKNAQHAQGNGGGRIPEDRYKANFGQEHKFRVNQGEYGNRRFQYGGYWFGFVDVWPSNWLYTQDVYVIEINGVYYLCNAMYPGVNVTLNVIL
jgi:hypothetical protein